MKAIVAVGTALKCEAIKVRGTSAVWLTVLSPALTVFIQMFWIRSVRVEPSGLTQWHYWFRMILVLWGLVVLPCLAMLQCASLAGVEQGGRNWSFLLSTPTPAWTMVTAKALVSNVLACAGTLLLVSFSVLGGLVLHLIRVDFPLVFGSEVAFAVRVCLLMYLASWLQVAIQLWISLRSSSFVTPIGAGMIPFVIGVAMVRVDAIRWSPWHLQLNMVLNGGTKPVLAALVGVVGGVLVTIVSCIDLSRYRLGSRP
jgi:hypothetical protein